jgi:fatty-acyl-CoA synthase
MTDAEPSYEFPEVEEQSTALLMFTSGTTGKPKAVAHTHRMVYLHSVGMVASKGVGPQDSQFMVPPMFHLGWLLWTVAPAAGSRLILPGPGYPDNLANLLLAEEVTFTAGVATLFKRVVDIVHERNEAGEDIRLDGTEIVFGGQSPPTPLLRQLENLGATTSQVYGYTEAGPQFTYNIQNHLRDREEAMSPDELFQYKADVAGYFVTGVEAKIIDPDTGDELPWDGESEGEIAFRAPWGTAGYWEMPEKTAEAMTDDGFLKMGDLVRIDEYGNVEVLDRIKDVIKSGGEWIPSPVLDDLLTEHEDVDDAVVVAAKHEEWMERPIAVVTLREGADEDALDLDAHLAPYVESGEIEKWWVPDRVIVVDEIPKTSVGKYDKKTLRDRYETVLVEES